MSTSRTPAEFRAYLEKALDGREIEDIKLTAEEVEIAPLDGWRRHAMTGRWFIEITAMKPSDRLVVPLD